MRVRLIVAGVFSIVFSNIVSGLPCGTDICGDKVNVPVRDSVEMLVMFWNLENFFDYQDSGAGESDHDFSPEGSRHWTASRFYHKCDAVAKSVLWVADKYGRLPDVIGVAEVENRKVLDKLIYNTVLRKYGYAVIHRDSPDHRGIDVAFLWRRDSLRLLNNIVRRIDSMATRDIIAADFELKGSGRRIVLSANHFPSKYGGSATVGRRAAAATELKSLCDSVTSSGTVSFVAMGDFNDVPSSDAFDVLRTSMVNLADGFEQKGSGTIRFNGRWETIDMFWVTEPLKYFVSMDIVNLPFLMVWDNVHPGFKPLRTYSGPRYLGGVSDHCPIVMTVRSE